MSLRRISTCTARSLIQLGRRSNVLQKSTRLTPLFHTEPPFAALRQFSSGTRLFEKPPTSTASPSASASASASASPSDSVEELSFGGDYDEKEQNAREYDGDITESRRAAEIREKVVKEHKQKVQEQRFNFGFFEFALYTMCVFVVIDMLGLDFWDFDDREKRA